MRIRTIVVGFKPISTFTKPIEHIYLYVLYSMLEHK